MASASNSSIPDDPDKPCEKCGAPASWADEWTNNLSYNQGTRYQFNKYLASPRMWPVGYITASPYSPFYLEHQIPNRNWRDAFEDLLALDSGGLMIDPESRKQEAVVAGRLWKERIFGLVSTLNKQLERDQKYMSLLKRMRAAFVSAKATHMVQVFDEKNIPHQLQASKSCVAEGERMISMLKNNETKDWPASKHKMRGQWIASLASSGAMTGWESNVYDSPDGNLINFRTTEPSSEDGEHDGYSVTEIELHKHFEENITAQYIGPIWSTASLQYPPAFEQQLSGPEQDVLDNDGIDLKTSPATLSVVPTSLMPTSILAQNMRAERTMLRNGKMSVTVLLKTFHTNGHVQEKEVKDDACKVLEEVERVHDSMAAMHNAIANAFHEQSCAMHEEVL